MSEQPVSYSPFQSADEPPVVVNSGEAVRLIEARAARDAAWSRLLAAIGGLGLHTSARYALEDLAMEYGHASQDVGCQIALDVCHRRP